MKDDETRSEGEPVEGNNGPAWFTFCFVGVFNAALRLVLPPRVVGVITCAVSIWVRHFSSFFFFFSSFLWVCVCVCAWRGDNDEKWDRRAASSNFLLFSVLLFLFTIFCFFPRFTWRSCRGPRTPSRCHASPSWRR